MGLSEPKNSLMKKMFLISLVGSFSLSNCQRDNYDDYANGTPEQPQSKEMFNPPSWIYGNWGTKIGTNTQVYYVFNENNILYYESAALLSMKADPNIKSVKEEVVSDTEYKLYVVKYDIGNTTSTKYYHFVKVSDTKIYFKTFGVNYVKL